MKSRKLTDSSQMRGILFPSADERICLGVCNDDMGHNYASTSGHFKAISSSSLSLGGGGGIGGKGRRGRDSGQGKKGGIRSKV